MSWRDHLGVHPAADLFPMMSESELDELAKDITKRDGLLHNIALYKGELLDGRNRLEALEWPGAPLNFMDAMDAAERLDPSIDPYEYVLSVNINRRHLTEEQRREVIAKLIKAKPEASDRAIAKKVKRDHKTVAKVRKKMESTGEVSPVQKRVGADGKKRKKPAKKQEERDRKTCVELNQKVLDAERERARWLADHPAAEQCATGSAEVSIEQRQAEMARLDEPSEDTTTEFDRRVNFVIITAFGQLVGLSRSEAERFFAALRDRLDDLEREQLRGEVAKRRSGHEIPGDLSVPDFLRRAPA